MIELSLNVLFQIICSLLGNMNLDNVNRLLQEIISMSR